MGTGVLLSLTSFLLPSSPTFHSPVKVITHRFPNRNFATRYGYGGSNWDSNAESTVRSQRFGFYSDDEDEFPCYDDHEQSAFRSSRPRRAWWSDDADDIHDFEDDDGLGVLEGSIGIAWIFKVFRAFGWMLPAIIISMLLGTGTNALFMALGLPLAQSAFSLVVDLVLERTNNKSRRKARPKKRPFAGDGYNVRMDKRKEQNSAKKEGMMNDQFQAAMHDSAAKRTDGGAVNFGGWDDLDRQEKKAKIPTAAPIQNADGSRHPKSSKLSMRSRNNETPLMLRLLIALFPFLGSWTKIL